MTNFKSGDIVLIEVIFSEQNESKKNPYHEKRNFKN